jgi:hypothetical protein
MLKWIRRIDWWVAAGMALCLASAALTLSLISAAVAYAQDTAPALPIGANDQEKLVIALFACVLPFVTKWIRQVKPTMPRMLVWSIPPVLGLATGWVASYFTQGATNGWRGLAGGLIAIALWEAKTTFGDHGVNG